MSVDLVCIDPIINKRRCNERRILAVEIADANGTGSGNLMKKHIYPSIVIHLSAVSSVVALVWTLHKEIGL